jgi:hypothetical protein
MVSALDQLKVAAGVALVTATPIAEAFADAKCRAADVVCGPMAPVQSHGAEGGAPSGPPATVQVTMTGTGTGTGTDAAPPAPMPPGRGWTGVMEPDAPYHRNQSAVWAGVR